MNPAINKDMPYFCMNVSGGGTITRVAEYIVTVDWARSINFRLKWFFPRVVNSYSSPLLIGFTPAAIYPSRLSTIPNERLFREHRNEIQRD